MKNDNWEAIKINPEYVDAHYFLGNILYKKGLINEALKEYEKALEIDPKKYSVYFNLGIAFKSKHFYNRALEAFENFIKYVPLSFSAEIQRAKEFITELKGKLSHSE